MNTNCIRAYHQRDVSGGDGKEASQSCPLFGSMAHGCEVGDVAKFGGSAPDLSRHGFGENIKRSSSVGV